MADARSFTDGSSSLVLGADSYTQSTDLLDREFVMGQNVVCRGGIVQTRPGTRSLYCLPDGNLQGFTVFTPANGVVHLVAAVDGKIYVSPAPFTTYYRLWNLQFAVDARFIAWCSTLKSTDINNGGELVTIDQPYSVLIIQDGATRAGYWDGATSGHLNPAPDPDVTDDTPVPGTLQTPIGLWMIWSGNRLWVSYENKIYASDIGDPLSFTENTYPNETRGFTLSGPCTGMTEVPAQDAESKGFIAFTANDGTMFQSYIQDRTEWLSTPLFANTILPNVGCVAPRSIVTQYGMNWWFAARGFTNLNAAFRQKLSSRIDYQDNQMFTSKAFLSPDLAGICSGYYENYLMCSVPSADTKNRHTWVLDQAPFENNAPAWCGIWTGWHPVEWGRGIVDGAERVFFASIDYDGHNRVWEAMLEERKDNGCRITCYLQTREHAYGNLEEKRYEWSKFFLKECYGTVDLDVYVASTKGSFQKQKSFHIEATEGQIYADQMYSEQGTEALPLMVGNRPQSRTIRTPGDPNDNECNACGVESQKGNMIDYAFSHLMVWSGQMGVRAYQVNSRQSPERMSGDCEEAEVGPRTLNFAGCSGLQLFVDGQVFETYTGAADGTFVLSTGQTVYIQRTAESPISTAHATSLAECAVAQVQNQLSDSDFTDGDFANIPSDGLSGIIINPPAVLPIPEPILASECESESGTATLCGMNEYADESSPPKRYRIQTLSGMTTRCLGMAADCTGNTSSTNQRVYSGQMIYDAATCDITNTQLCVLRGAGFPAGVPCQTGMSDEGTLVPTYPPNFDNYGVPSHFVNVTTSTTTTLTGDNVCDLGDLYGGSATGILSDEDTEQAAAQRAMTTPGASCTARTQSRGSGVFIFQFTSCTVTYTITNLVAGHPYILHYEELEEDDGGGNPVVTPVLHPFTPGSGTEVIAIPIFANSGKQLTLQNATVST